MWVHLVLGLTGAVLLAVVGITGVYITFQRPLEGWLNPIPSVPAFGGSPDLTAIVSAAEARFAPRRVARVEVRPQGEATIVRLRDRTIVFVNPGDATIIGSREARFASLENLTAVMRRLHTNLLLGRKGRLLVTAATAEALLLVLTGLWLWWRKKHWQFRPWRGSVFRVSWDLHNATGIWFFVPLLSMVITGLLMSMPAPVPASKTVPQRSQTSVLPLRVKLPMRVCGPSSIWKVATIELFTKHTKPLYESQACLSTHGFLFCASLWHNKCS